MFASDYNEKAVLIQSSHICSALPHPGRLHSVQSGSQGEKFIPCFPHSHSMRSYSPPKWKVTVLAPGLQQTPVPTYVPSVSQQSFGCPNGLRDSMEDNS